MYKREYEDKMKSILRDGCSHKTLRRDPTSTLQQKNNNFVEALFKQEIINKQEKQKMTNYTATAPRLYGLPKIHKDNFPLRPICSSLNSPSHTLSKYIANILKTLTESSKYNIKDTIEFKNRVNNTYIYDDEEMVSFDVVSLFPSIPVEFAIKKVDIQWDKIEKLTKMPKKLFMEILRFCVKENNYFIYDGTIYSQLKGMPMGSPISPIIADIVMEAILDEFMSNIVHKPRLLTKYVDDIFAIVKKEEMDNTLNELNKCNRHLQFTKETEEEGSLPYLDTLLTKKNNIIKTDWYQKPTASGRLINFHSKHPKNVIFNTAKNFIRRVFSISDKVFHKYNRRRITTTLKKNDFPPHTINHLLKAHSNNTSHTTITTSSEPKLFKPITYVPGFSEKFKKSDIYNSTNYTLALKTTNTLKSVHSKIKDKVNSLEKCDVVYNIECKGDESHICKKVYVGTTKSKLKTRLSAHKSDLKSKLT